MSQETILVAIIAAIYVLVILLIIVKVSFDWGFKKGVEWNGNTPRFNFKIRNQSDGQR